MSLDSAEDCFQRGTEYFMDANFEDSLTELSAAIELDDSNPRYFLTRAGTHLKLKRFEEAIQDANKSLELKPDNNTAYFRLGMAHWNLLKYQKSKESFEKAKELGHKKCDLWIRKCDAEIEDAENPAADVRPLKKAKSEPATPQTNNQPVEAKSATEEAPVAVARPTALEKIRTSFIQNASRVTFSIFCKNLTTKDVKITYQTQQFSVDISLPDGASYQREWNLLREIVPSQCTHKVNKFKVQIFLKKAQHGEWESLEPVSAKSEQIKERDNLVSEAATTAYPSSGKKVIDWDLLDREQGEDLKNEKVEGDAALNKLFQDIYSKADPNTQRAMIKSMQTSGGTVLSTNWGEVKDKNYDDEISAPDGQEVHRWNENK